MRTKGQAGFTIVEVVVVLGVVAIIIAAGVAALNSSRTLARSQDRVNKIGEIATSIDRYLQQNGTLPSETVGSLVFEEDRVRIGQDIVNLPGFLRYADEGETTVQQTRYAYARDFGDYQICVQQESGSWEGTGSGTNLCP